MLTFKTVPSGPLQSLFIPWLIFDPLTLDNLTHQLISRSWAFDFSYSTLSGIQQVPNKHLNERTVAGTVTQAHSCLQHYSRLLTIEWLTFWWAKGEGLELASSLRDALCLQRAQERSGAWFNVLLSFQNSSYIFLHLNFQCSLLYRLSSGITGTSHHIQSMWDWKPYSGPFACWQIFYPVNLCDTTGTGCSVSLHHGLCLPKKQGSNSQSWALCSRQNLLLF